MVGSAVKLGDKSNIAIIDFGPFLDGSNKQEVANAMLASFKETGFVYLLNHGLAEDKLKMMFDWSKKFFGQPMVVKQLAPHPPSGTHHRGYSAPGREQVYQMPKEEELPGQDRSSDDRKQVTPPAPDMKESFECGREDDSMSPNIWFPDGVLPGFKETCMDFFWACHAVQLTVLRALALGLNAPEDYFDKYHTEPDNQLRLLHYPSVSAEALRKQEIGRIGAHSDFCTLTLLFQDDVGGLEVEDPNNPGVFKPVPPVTGAMIVNVGDFLMRWSNDIVRSTVHRVRAPTNIYSENGMLPERYSIPYFCSADLSAVVDCIPGTWSDERPKRYEPTSALDYVMKRLAANY